MNDRPYPVRGRGAEHQCLEVNRVAEESVRLHAVEEAQTCDGGVGEVLNHRYESVAERTDEQSCEQPLTVDWPERRADGERTDGSKPEQPARAPQVEAEDTDDPARRGQGDTSATARKALAALAGQRAGWVT